LNRRRAVYHGDDARQQRSSQFDDGVMYNTTFLTIKRTGPRTSMIIDPPNGCLPPQTPEAAPPRPTGSFSLRCCNRPSPARARSRYAPEASMIRRRRRDFQNRRRAIMPATSRA
jgi:hypothetical protein